MNDFAELQTKKEIEKWTQERLEGGIGDTKNGLSDIYMKVGEILRLSTGRKHQLLKDVLTYFYEEISKEPENFSEAFIKNLHLTLLNLKELPSSTKKLARRNAKNKQFPNQYNKNLQLLTWFNIKMSETFWLSLVEDYPLFAYSGVRQNFGSEKTFKVLDKIDLSDNDVVTRIYMEARAELQNQKWSESNFKEYWNKVTKKYDVSEEFVLDS